MHHQADRRGDAKTDAIGDAVGDVERLDLERADLEHLTGAERDQLDVVQAAGLAQLGLDQAQRQRRGVDRCADVLDHVRQRADVVFVAVSDEDGTDFGEAILFHQVVVIGNDEIDAEHVIFGEHDAGIDDEDVVLILEGGHVFADLTQPTQGQNT